MSGFNVLDCVHLPNGVEVRPGTRIVVQEPVEYEQRKFEQGDYFAVKRISWSSENNSLFFWCEPAPYDVLMWDFVVDAVETGRFVVANTNEQNVGEWESLE